MIVVVGEHPCAVHVFARGADAQHSGVAVADDLTKTVFGVAGAGTPYLRGVAQFGLAVFDVKINRFGCRAVENNPVVASGFEIGSPVAAGRAASECRVRQWAQIDGGHFGTAGSETVASKWSSHHHDDVLRTERRGVERQLVH